MDKTAAATINRMPKMKLGLNVAEAVLTKVKEVPHKKAVISNANLARRSIFLFIDFTSFFIDRLFCKKHKNI